MTENINYSNRFVSYQQLDLLWEFLNNNRPIANSYNRSNQAKEYAKRKWREIAEVLNAQDGAATKEWNEWAKFWAAYKSRLKKRVGAIRAAQVATGGGPSRGEEQPLSEMELKFLQILGSDFGQGLPGVRVEPFPEISERIVSVEHELPEPVYSQHSYSSDNIFTPPSPPTAALFTGLIAATASASTTATTPAATPATTPAATPAATSAATPAATPAATSAATPADASFAPDVTAASAPTARPNHPRRRRNNPYMTQETARLDLVQSSRIRAEASKLMAEAMMRQAIGIEGIMNSVQNMERFLRNAHQSDANTL